MKVLNIQNNTNFKSSQTQATQKKHEFIDFFQDKVRNPQDVNDCVAVPRGIFKAYLYLMAGSGLISIANFLPKKCVALRTFANVTGALFGFVSAVYFAKPFAVKGLSPTVKKEDINQ